MPAEPERGAKANCGWLVLPSSIEWPGVRWRWRWRWCGAKREAEERVEEEKKEEEEEKVAEEVGWVFCSKARSSAKSKMSTRPVRVQMARGMEDDLRLLVLLRLALLVLLVVLQVSPAEHEDEHELHDALSLPSLEEDKALLCDCGDEAGLASHRAKENETSSFSSFDPHRARAGCVLGRRRRGRRGGGDDCTGVDMKQRGEVEREKEWQGLGRAGG